MKSIPPGLYFFHNYQNVDGGALHVGSEAAFTWAQMQPAAGQLNDTFDRWAAPERARGKKLVLRADVHQNRGAASLPGWAPRLRLKMASGAYVDVPDYKNAAFQAQLCDFVKLLGARYDADPDVVLVQIALGLYGETHPEMDDAQGALLTQLDPHLNACQWIAYAKRVMLAYRDAFPQTELAIMNAPSYGMPCRLGADQAYRSVWARRELDDYALSLGIGAQNNSWDEWDSKWFTATITGSNGPYTVDGCVGPFVEAGRMLAFERGSWATSGPFPTQWGAGTSLTWWCYLNALSKGAPVLFPPNWAGKVLVPGTKSYHEYPAGVFNYAGPYADDLAWMNEFAARSLRGELQWWAAFEAPLDAGWRQTAQTWDHELGLHRASPMPAEWDAAGAKPPFYESKYLRRFPAGPVSFVAERPGRYHVAVWHRGDVALLGQTFHASDWQMRTFEADVPASFEVAGTGHLHAIILEPAAAPPVEPPTDPPEPPAEEPSEATVTLRGKRITIRVEDL